MVPGADLRVVLASRSPQRREILERLGISFDVEPSGAGEARGGDPAETILENAQRKARSVAPDHAGALIIGCDTDVVVEGETLGKPADPAEARRHLGLLSSRRHEVLSGLALIGPGDGQQRHGLARSTVTFHDLTPGEINRYVSSGEWRQRAGGYAIQGLGSTLVAAVEGDIANVIGLPLALLLDLAPELGSLVNPDDA